MMIFLFFGAAQAEEKKVMTRAEVIDKLSTTDFLKKKIGDLLSWGVGYDITKINRTNLAPSISFIKATPVKAPPDNRTVISLVAKVEDPSGLENIRGVRADLSGIKKLPNTMLVDNGLWGDEKSGDGIYTLQTNIGYDVTNGSKDIPVAVANKAGWVAVGRTNLNVEMNPVISEINVVPMSPPADGKTVVNMTVKIDNPGRPEDIRSVVSDMSDLGLDKTVHLHDDGLNGDVKAFDTIYTYQFIIRAGVSPGKKKITIKAENASGGKSSEDHLLEVK
jgi:hypothetical protein